MINVKGIKEKYEQHKNNHFLNCVVLTQSKQQQKHKII